jgi:hypothetical protein
MAAATAAPSIDEAKAKSVLRQVSDPAFLLFVHGGFLPLLAILFEHLFLGGRFELLIWFGCRRWSSTSATATSRAISS